MTVKMAKWVFASVWILIFESLAGMAILAFTHHWFGALIMFVNLFFLVPSTWDIAQWIDANSPHPAQESMHHH